MSKTLDTKSVTSENNVWPIPQLQENVHFYMDDGLMVFTEAYHRARGSCCGNVCRHCPYEFSNVVEHTRDANSETN